MIEYKKFHNARQWAFFHYRYSQYLHTKEQSDTFRVWGLIILLKCAKCDGPARVNLQLLTSKQKAYQYHVHIIILYMRCVRVRCTMNIVHKIKRIYFVHSIYIYSQTSIIRSSVIRGPRLSVVFETKI